MRPNTNQLIKGITLLMLFFLFLPSIQAQSSKEKVTELALTCQKYWRIDLDSALYFGHKAVNLAIAEKMKSDDAARAFMYLGVTHFYLSDYDSAIIMVTEGLDISNEIDSDQGRGFAYNLLTLLTRKNRDYEKSIEYGEMTIDFRKADKDTNNLSGAYNNLANTYNAMGDYESALDNFLISMELKLAVNDTVGIIEGHANIADIYIQIGEVNLAKQHIDKAMLITPKGSLWYADNILTLGDLFHSHFNQPDTALVLYREALEIYEEIGIPDGVASANQNIGSVLITLKKYDQVMPYLNNAKGIFVDMDAFEDVAFVDMTIGEYYRKINNYDSSFFYLNHSLKVSREYNSFEVIKSNLGLLYELNKQFKYYQKSLDYLEQYKAYTDSLVSKETYDKIAVLETKYKTAEQQKQIVELQYEKERDLRHRQLLYGTIIFIVVLVLIATIAMYIRTKKQREINRQKQQLLMSEKKLAEAEIEKRKIKQQEMENDLEHKTRQLSSHALHMMQKSKMLQEVKEKLDDTIKLVDGKCSPKLKEISRLIVQNMRTEKEWELFKMYFEQVNSSFYDKLKERNPELSQTDIRMCSLIKLGLNLKETASVLNVAPNTVKNARYRVKLKLGLSNDESLSEYVGSL